MPTKKLGEYKRKRRFQRTPEPEGKVAKRGRALRFIVHLHDATRLHYDLRLEMGGVLKSWAVPKGPSLNPTEQRLAVHVEDHPMDYGDFEGIIPEGNYGAGPVIVWDKGTYHERRSTSAAQSEKALAKGYAKGHITFVLRGKKLHGEFALIRLRDGKNWLLIKKGDAHSSYRDVDWDMASVVSKKSLADLRGKPPAAVWTRKGKSQLPRVRLAVPSTRAQDTSGKQWIVQAFGAGERALVEKENTQVRLLSKVRVPLAKKYPRVARALAQLGPDLVLDGEVFKEPERFSILDLLFIDGEDLRENPLKTRLARLAKLKLPKGVEIAASIRSSAESTWIARRDNSVYPQGISREWVRGRQSHTIRLHTSHPDKKLWPQEGYTKADLLEYYRAVAPVMLPHLRDRPLSLQRFPNGIEAPGFFQKDLIGQMPKDIVTFAHFSKSSNRTIHYAVCQDETTLLYLANLACIELNPWMSRTTDIDAADYCVIDLDPDDNPFSKVVEVALAYKELLDSIGAKAFCKTSGATGLHLCIPWKGKVAFDESREFALALSRRIHEQFPKQTSLERSPARRRGKIYLDCFQNARGQTIVAPYSLRPRAGAPVSTPLEWNEVTSKLNPAKHTLASVPKRLARMQDPWKDLKAAGNQLSKLLKQLG